MPPSAILHTPQPLFAPPAPPRAGVKIALAFGQELFGRHVGPWSTLLRPVPVGALLLVILKVYAIGALGWPWLTERIGELAWLGFMPFFLATVGQAVAMAASDMLWRESEGERHLDFSPHAWHYGVATAIALVPLVLLNCWTPFLDAYLEVTLRLGDLFGLPLGHVGYSPSFANLIVVGALPLVFGQVRGLVEKIPAGRLLGLQRELARLRGAVTWQREAWCELVELTIDRWLADVAPPSVSSPLRGERARQHRVRWGGLRKELIASWQQSPPDLARANRAVQVYRQGW